MKCASNYAKFLLRPFVALTLGYLTVFTDSDFVHRCCTMPIMSLNHIWSGVLASYICYLQSSLEAHPSLEWDNVNAVLLKERVLPAALRVAVNVPDCAALLAAV